MLLLCSSFFALYHSNTAYISDEVWSIKAASLDFRSGMETLKADVHPPLYFQILHLWIRLFGTGERTVRSLSGLFYVLSVFAVYGLGGELYGKKTAVLCSALYLSSPLAIISAQFARMYSLLSLLSILSSWLYLQFSSKPRDSRLPLALYVAVNILGTFTHVAFFFLLFAQLVFHLIFYRRIRMKTFIVAIVFSLIPYLLLWAPVVVGQIINSAEGLAWLKKPRLSAIADLLMLYGGVLWLILPVLLFVWWRTGFDSLKSFSKLNIRSPPLWLMAITLLTPLLISQVKPIFNSRLAVVGLHFFSLVVGALIGRATNYLLPLLIVVLTAFGMFLHFPGSSICDNRQMAAYLNQTANDDDVVIFTSLTRLPIDYYLERTTRTKKLFETTFPAEIDRHPGYEGRIADAGRKEALEQEAQLLIEKIAGMQSRGWRGQVFFFHGRYPQIDPIVDERLRQRFRLINTHGVRCSQDSAYFEEVSVYK